MDYAVTVPQHETHLTTLMEEVQSEELTNAFARDLHPMQIIVTGHGVCAVLLISSQPLAENSPQPGLDLLNRTPYPSI